MISPELLFSESHRQAFCSGSDLERQCAELLEGYRDWWLRGGGEEMEKNDLEQRSHRSGFLIR